MSREEIIIQLLRDYEHLLGDDSNYCKIAEIRFSIKHLEEKIKESQRVCEEICVL
jgi:hypothetical protein